MGLKWECPTDQACSAWALSYFSDCVCSRRDMISFFLGIISIGCWAVAEIPQILANWRSTNTENVSLAFIFTWMIGDVFNLVGCWINPGTLPTQLYLAALYSATTLPLVVQQIWSAWKSCRDSPKFPDAEPLLGRARADARPPGWPNHSDSNSLACTPSTQSLPVISKREGRPRAPIPVTASLPVQQYSRERGSALARANLQSPPGPYSGSWRRLTLSNSYGASGSPARSGLMFASLAIVGVTLVVLSPFDGGHGFKQHGPVSWGWGERRQLLQEYKGSDMAQTMGLILGWLMACIYLTGRLPQIILNWSREFVIGVSVPTLVFAFIGNATYLGSILVRSVKWRRLKLVLPWVVDISSCLFMDFFMIFQFLIHRHKHGYTTLN